jgi:hypothetical protein
VELHAIPSQHPGPVPTKQQLVLHYQQTTRTYADAVAELNQRIGTSSKVEYEAIIRMAEVARAASSAAREALQKHTDAEGRRSQASHISI